MEVLVSSSCNTMKNYSRKWILIFILMACIGSVMLMKYNKSTLFNTKQESYNIYLDIDFLTWLRFKDISSNSTYSYNFELIKKSDSTFKPHNKLHYTQWYTIVTWNGDTVYSIPSIGHGVYNENPNLIYSGYNSNIIKFNEDELIPVKVGETTLIIKYPKYSDTLSIFISENENGKFKLKVEQPQREE